MLDAVVGMCICNDRRWPETYRVMGLQGVEIVALGYNTPIENIHTREPEHLRMFHHLLSMQAGAYQNAAWVLAAAKCGAEDGFGLIGGSAIIAPTGEIAARRSARTTRSSPRPSISNSATTCGARSSTSRSTAASSTTA